MDDERLDQDFSQGSVVIGGTEEQPVRRRPGLLLMIAILVGLVAAGLALGSVNSGLTTSDDVIAGRTPALAAIYGFFETLSAGEAVDSESYLDPDFTVLQLPHPFDFDFSVDVNVVDGSVTLAQAQERISRQLSILAALKPDLSVHNCESEVPRSSRGQELYDSMVTCRLRWHDGLRDTLDAPPVNLMIEVGVHNGLIRGLFLESPEVPSDPEQMDPVQFMFLGWLSQQHPAVTADLFQWTPWGVPWELKSATAASELLSYAEEFAVGFANFETTGTLTTQFVPPNRVRHSMVYRGSTGQILLIGGMAGQPINDMWSFNTKDGVWLPAGTIDLDPETTIVAAVRHPSTDQIVAIAQHLFTSEVSIWVLSYDTNDWIPMEPPPQEDERCFDPPGLIPDPGSGNFLVVLCDGAWLFDPENETWTPSPDMERVFFDLVRSLLPEDISTAGIDGLFATTFTSDVLVGAGAGQIRSLDVNTGQVATLETGGPAVVPAITFDSGASLLIMIGDGALWSFDLEDNTIERLMELPVRGGSEVGMFWRTAAAAYDESAGVVVIFDGEHTWTFNADSSQLRPQP